MDEKEHVQKVYENIAQHFSETRYKPWPVIDNFLKNLEVGAVGADVGCGNGKYLAVRSDICIFGTDASPSLLNIANSKCPFTFIADNQSLPIRTGIMDFCISIAVIHHFSSKERRLKAIDELCRILSPNGLCLIFVWSFEQKGRFNFSEQDVLVPWKLTKKHDENETVYQRFYHVFKQGELEELVYEHNSSSCFKVEIVDGGYDKDNWYIILKRKAE